MRRCVRTILTICGWRENYTICIGRQERILMGIIEAKNLVHEYIIRDEEGNVESIQTALDHMDLKVEPGQFIAVLGHNGSGKSTFAKHINALLTPTEGTLIVDGMDASDEDNTYAIRQTAGMVFQNPDNQIIGTCVEEDVAFGPENKCVEPSKIREIVDMCLSIVGLSAKRKESPMRLSGGEKQRVAVAGALASSPEVLVLDEPTAMLDPNSRREVIRVIHQLNKEKGMTIVLITHHMDEVLEADRIVLMSKGGILATGTPEEIFSDKELIQRAKLEMPQLVELGFRLKARGIDIRTPVLSEEYLIDRLNELAREGK